jgi:FAD:protein FMN transferase
MTAADESPVQRFAHAAMNTTFEVIISGEEADYARQASQAAFEEVDHLEQELSRFDPTSDVSQINGLRAGKKLRVGLATLECLKAAAAVAADTGGAFDVTIGSLLACWRSPDKSLRTPTQAELDAARARTGMNHVEILDDEYAVRLKADGVKIDLGGVGKGYAVDRMMAVLKQWSVKTALVHGGYSSVLALGAPPKAPRVGDERGWKLAIRQDSGDTPALGYVYLKDRSLSGSAAPPVDQHIIDPRTGRPAEGNRNAWAIAPSATVTDCLSTAFIVMTPAEVEAYIKRHADTAAMIVPRRPEGSKPISLGKWDAVFETLSSK